MSTARARAEQLRALHRSGEPLLLVNAWDAVTARIIEQLGFPAVATTSAGVAWAEGFADGERISRKQMLARVEVIARAVDVPLSADLEGGYGSSVEDAAATARGAIESGAVGLNFEDGREGDRQLMGCDVQCLRIEAMREAALMLDVPLVINARTDVFLAKVGNDDAWRLEEAVGRGNRYLAAGADCIFVPGVSDEQLIAHLAARINGPLNILASSATPPVDRLRTLGVARVSLGSGATGYVLAKLREAAAQLKERGSFDFLAQRITHADTNALFQTAGKALS
jgi:2-methylisocitrate lyase-like PEP mutase family enzyme